MTIDEAISRIERLINSLDKEFVAISETVAINARALIVKRIQEKGIGESYSTNPIPAYLFLLDESNLDTQTTINFVKQKEEAGEEITWADIRIAHGNQTAFVDLTFTGRMLMNIGIIKTVKSGRKYITILGGMDEETRKKIDWNTKRYGPFLKPTAEEVKMLTSLSNDMLIRTQKSYLGI